MRNIALSVNWNRPAAVTAAENLCNLLTKAGIKVFSISEPGMVQVANCQFVTENELPNLESVLVIGGDGTILRSAELAKQFDLPLLGINHGHVGFLAEAEASDIPQIAEAIVAKNWSIEERLTLDVSVRHEGNLIW